MRATVNPESALAGAGRAGVTFGTQATMYWFYAVYGSQSVGTGFIGMPYETARWQPALGQGKHRRHVVLPPTNAG
jgi:hypothetical protein